METANDDIFLGLEQQELAFESTFSDTPAVFSLQQDEPTPVEPVAVETPNERINTHKLPPRPEHHPHDTRDNNLDSIENRKKIQLANTINKLQSLFASKPYPRHLIYSSISIAIVGVLTLAWLYQTDMAALHVAEQTDIAPPVVTTFKPRQEIISTVPTPVIPAPMPVVTNPEPAIVAKVEVKEKETPALKTAVSDTKPAAPLLEKEKVEEPANITAVIVAPSPAPAAVVIPTAKTATVSAPVKDILIKKPSPKAPVEKLVVATPKKPILFTAGTDIGEKTINISMSAEAKNIAAEKTQPSSQALDSLLHRFEKAYQQGDLNALQATMHKSLITNDDKDFQQASHEYQQLFLITDQRQLHFNNINWQFEEDIARGKGEFEASITEKGRRHSRNLNGSIDITIDTSSADVNIAEIYYTYDH
jgi:hypothetical protein